MIVLNFTEEDIWLKRLKPMETVSAQIPSNLEQNHDNEVVASCSAIFFLGLLPNDRFSRTRFSACPNLADC